MNSITFIEKQNGINETIITCDDPIINDNEYINWDDCHERLYIFLSMKTFNKILEQIPKLKNEIYKLPKIFIPWSKDGYFINDFQFNLFISIGMFKKIPNIYKLISYGVKMEMIKIK